MKNILAIIKISRPLYGLLAIIAVLILLSSAINLVAPILSKLIVDEIVAKIQNQGGSFEKLVRLILFSFLASLAGIAITGVSERLGDHFSGKLRKFLTEKFYDKVFTLPQNYFDSEVSGKIMNQLTRAIFAIGQFLNTATNFILPTLLQSIFTIAVLAYYNIPIAAFTFILFPIYLAISYYSTKKWGEREVAKNKIEDKNYGRIYQVISNIKLVRIFAGQKHEYAQVAKNLSRINKIYANQSQTYHLLDFLRNFSLILVFLAINIIAFYNTFTGAITLGTLVLIIQLVAQARYPLFAMSFILSNVQYAEAGSKEYFEILNLPAREDYKKSQRAKKLKNPSLQFKNVFFGYEKSDLVLKNISFKIDPLEKLALVGESGAGKTTIVNLICKFYEPASGEIYISGMPYSKLSHNVVRNNIALVFQESELFSSTIRKNVAYGKVGASEKQIIDALEKANAADFVKELPKGLDSEIGERGVRLSGGQKQRIQIARAILKDAPILILDEATSHLDAKSEMEVQMGLENLMRGKLVIIIAHRFSTIQNVNKILVIENYGIADSGSPGELAQKKGIYSDLLKFQIEGNKKLLEKFEIY